jgi:leader peptidase (prepilin peptidase)/N-methyltransferase
MAALIFFLGILLGLLLRICIEQFSYKVSNKKGSRYKLLIPFLTGLIFLMTFLKFQLDIIFFKVIFLVSILIIISFIDLRHRIIPNSLVIVTLITGIIFSFFGDISFVSSILGMMLGGGLIFLLAIVPNAMGGGDIKLMFALGAFLGHVRVLWALTFAFILASIVSMILLIFRIKDGKDYIPFGPFLALGTYISFLFFRG